MGVLKVRSGGAWVDVGVGGGPLPPGGVAGDIIVKNSVTNSDALWGTTMPKLKLTPGSTIALDQNNPALMIGEPTGQNLAAYWAGLQSRNNGAAAVLRFNYYGGTVAIAGGASGSTTLAIDEPTGTSKRTQLNLGSNWQFGQDSVGNGTKDLYLWSNAAAQNVISINPAGSIYNIGTGVTNAKLQVGSLGTATLQVGDDAYFQDLNITNGLAIRGVTNAAHGFLAFGAGSNQIGYNGELRLLASGAITSQCSVFQVLNVAGSTWLFQHDGTRLWTPQNFTADGNITAGSQIYSGIGAYFRVRGTGTGIYWDSVGGGLVMNAANWLQMYPGTNLSMENGIIRLRAYGDDNHKLQYYNGVPPGGGEASNGPLLQGYSSVWLHNVSANKPFFLASSGNVFIATGQSYLTMSSIENKENVIPLDPDDCLDHVARWRPVEFDARDDGHHAEGFIAEDHVQVTPMMVNICGPDSLRPGWANGVDYAGGTVRLAGAVQALLRRVEQLEGKAA